ncbi:MAG: TetR family transcriptional regulator [Desulfobacteraceae bacterium]
MQFGGMEPSPVFLAKRYSTRSIKGKNFMATDNDGKSIMRISDLVLRTGVPRTAIHYYIRKGLLHPPEKTGQTMAYYNESHVDRLIFITRMKHDLPGIFIKKMLLDKDESLIPESPPADFSEAAIDAESPRSGKRKKIIQTSLRIFSVKGYRNTTIHDITQALGISTGAFYIYFKNKQELFETAVEDLLLGLIDMVEDGVKNEDDPLRRLFVRGHMFYANYRKYSDIINQVRGEMVSFAWARDIMKKTYHHITAPLIKEAKALIESGVFRPVDPELFAFTLVGIVEAMSLRMTFDDTYSFEQIDRFLMDLIVKGFPYIPEQ